MELQPEILKKLQKKFKTLNSDISEIFVNVRNKIRYLDGASTRNFKKMQKKFKTLNSDISEIFLINSRFF